MTKTNATGDGLTVSFLESGFTYRLANTGPFGFSEISRRGQTIHLSADDIAASRDRTGNSFWTLSPQEQMQRWGKQCFRIGEWPDGEDLYVRGTPEWAEARESARREAWAAPASQRRAALAEVEEKFGPAPVTSKTLSRVVGDEERQQILEGEGLL